MSEILNLAEKFKQKQNEQAQTIEQEIQNVMQTLNDSMTAKLSESESIIKNGMANLKVSNEQLQDQLTHHLQDIQQLIDRTFSQFQTHTQQSLASDLSEINEMIESYTTRIAREIESRDSRISKIIKSDISKWSAVLGMLILVVFILGMLLGAKLTTPKAYKYYHDSKTGQTYMLPMQD